MEQKASETGSRKNAAADIIKKGSVITIITLISRPIGFVREAVQAYLFGVTRPVDAFIVAFNFPELIQNLFFSGATSAFLIPVCTKYLDDDNEYSKIILDVHQHRYRPYHPTFSSFSTSSAPP